MRALLRLCEVHVISAHQVPSSEVPAGSYIVLNLQTMFGTMLLQTMFGMMLWQCVIIFNLQTMFGTMLWQCAGPRTLTGTGTCRLMETPRQRRWGHSRAQPQRSMAAMRCSMPAPAMTSKGFNHPHAVVAGVITEPGANRSQQRAVVVRRVGAGCSM